MFYSIDIGLFNVNNGKVRTICEFRSKLVVKTPERLDVKQVMPAGSGPAPLSKKRLLRSSSLFKQKSLIVMFDWVLNTPLLNYATNKRENYPAKYLANKSFSPCRNVIPRYTSVIRYIHREYPHSISMVLVSLFKGFTLLLDYKLVSWLAERGWSLNFYA